MKAIKGFLLIGGLVAIVITLLMAEPTMTSVFIYLASCIVVLWVIFDGYKLDQEGKFDKDYKEE